MAASLAIIISMSAFIFKVKLKIHKNKLNFSDFEKN
jgi:hypothetical protein